MINQILLPAVGISIPLVRQATEGLFRSSILGIANAEAILAFAGIRTVNSVPWPARPHPASHTLSPLAYKTKIVYNGCRYEVGSDHFYSSFFRFMGYLPFDFNGLSHGPRTPLLREENLLKSPL